MTVRIEKKGKVWTVIHSRAEARNAMDPESADALVAAFQAFDKDPEAAVAVLWGEGGAFCAGWDLKYCATMVKDAKQLHEIDALNMTIESIAVKGANATGRVRSTYSGKSRITTLTLIREGSRWKISGVKQ